MVGDKWILVAFVWIWSIHSGLALAADSGFYFSAALGRTREMPKSAGRNFLVGSPPAGIVHIDPDHIDAENDSIAWGLGAGYRFNPYFAAELAYMDFGSIHVKENYNNIAYPEPFPFPSSFVYTYSSKVTGPALSMLGSAPIGEHFGVFVRAGVLFADRKLKDSQPNGFNETLGRKVWLGGVGISWSCARHWTIKAEYQRTGKLQQSLFSGATELEQFSLGLLFRR